jgi:lipoyl(octanoyl) transferase
MVIYWLGQVEYQRAWQLQRELAALRVDRKIGDTLLLLEHPPTITLGRGAKEEHILASRETLYERGVAVHAIDRGGDVTFHGKGQLVGYPIFHLGDYKKDIHWFIRQIEEAIILCLRDWGVEGERFPQHTGVWVDKEKVAAIGIKVSRWVSTHGFALNVSTDLREFELIVPCGIQQYGVTSLQSILQSDISMEAVIHSVSCAFAACFWKTMPDALGTGSLEQLSDNSHELLKKGRLISPCSERAINSDKKSSAWS